MAVTSPECDKESIAPSVLHCSFNTNEIIFKYRFTSEATAKQIADLKVLAASNNVKAVFTGLGTPAEVSEQLASELGIAAVSLSTHYLNGAANYREFMLNLANQIAEALR